MIDIKVIGHKVPDTDCVLSAIIACDYLSRKWYKATPYIQWKLNKETQYLFDIFKMDVPELKTSFPEGTRVCLVDHNELSQAPDNLSELDVAWIIDHHKVSIETVAPLYMRVEPICSTGSILYKMYQEAWFEINEHIAKLMLACILSDSLLFRSATTTKQDISIAEELKKISGITDLDKFAMPMFEAKSDLWDMAIEDVIKYDYKEFVINDKKLAIGTLETTDPWYALSRKDEILEWLIKIKESDSLDFIMLSVVDIVSEKNITIVLDWADSGVIKNTFWVEVIQNEADLKNRLSRKKQIVPDLTKYFNNM